MSKVKIEQNYREKYVPIVLWWDDVTEIFEILQSNAKAVELETSKYKFTTLEVAKEHFGDAPQYDVKISSSSPYCTLQGGQLYVGSGSTSAQTFLEIDRILKARQRRPRWIYRGWIVLPIVLVGLIGFTNFCRFYKRNSHGRAVYTFDFLSFCKLYLHSERARCSYMPEGGSAWFLPAQQRSATYVYHNWRGGRSCGLRSKPSERSLFPTGSSIENAMKYA